MPSLTDLGQAYQGPPQPEQTLLQKLGQTWPARMAKDALGALMLPGDVYQGNVPMTGEDGHTSLDAIGKAADLAGLVMGGSYAAPALKDASGMGIRAYHGSPHDFERFDLSKIGTGEGAQAYGHGLYFAENEKIAKSYRDQLANGVYSTKDGVFDPSNLGHLNVRVAARNGIDDGIARAQELLKSQPQNAEMLQRDIQMLQDARARGAAPNPGHMYEVNINADPAHFLDWDKPLSQQHPQTVEAVKQSMGPNWDQFKSAKAGDAVKQGFIAPGEETTAARLHQAGIPGIKYLDQGSRAAGDGSRNYVVFNDSLIDILKKYGLAGAAPAGVLAYAQQQDSQL